MTGIDPTSHETEIRSLIEELHEVKELLREISRQTLRIERRVRAAFPNIQLQTSRPKARTAGPRLNEQVARQLLDRLSERIMKGEDVDSILRGYSVKPDLQLIASLLGMTNVKLPPKDELIRRISTRLRQGISVKSAIQGT